MGSELLDCENEETPIEEFQEECNNEDVELEENNENRDSVVVPTANGNLKSILSLFTNDPDSKFLDKFQEIMKDKKTLKLFIPYMSKFRATYQKARRSLKKRTDAKASTINCNLQDQQVCDLLDDTETSADDPL